MSDIRFNQWLHQSGTGGVSQVDGGHVGIGTTNPDIAVHSANAKKLNVGIVTANSIYASNYYGNGSNLTGIGDADKIIEGDTKVEVVDSGDQYIVGEVNGSEKVRITSAGLVQIGLTGMSGGNDQALAVNNPAGNANVLELSTSSSSGRINCSRTLSNTLNTTSFIEWNEPGAQGTGELRFGTSASSNNPTERLRITSTGRIQIGNGSGVNASAPMELQVSSSSAWGDYPEHITLVDQKAYNAADNGAGIQFGGKYNNAGNATTFGSIHGKKATTGDGNFGGILTFNTREHGNSNFERMRIDSYGRVFINSVGATTPTADYRSLNLVAHAHSEAGISFSRSHTLLGSGSTAGKSIILLTDGALSFQTHNVGERMRITQTGNVGINQSNPTDKLHVNGTTNFVGNSYIGGDLYMYGNSYGNGVFLGGSNAVHKLDYYKKGTWTPSIWRANHGSEIPLGSGNRFGHYVRVGDLLHISFYWYNPSLSSSNGTYWIVRDLPFNLLSGSGGAYQFIPGGYFYQQGDSTGDSGSNGSYRWQANGTFSANTLTLYAANNSRDANGATEFSGSGTLIVA